MSAIFSLEEMISKLKNSNVDVVLVLKHRQIKKIKELDKTKIFEQVKMCSCLKAAAK